MKFPAFILNAGCKITPRPLLTPGWLPLGLACRQHNPCLRNSKGVSTILETTQCVCAHVIMLHRAGWQPACVASTVKMVAQAAQLTSAAHTDSFVFALCCHNANH
jgi:hypothetical protein